ncbi:MAG: DEAD/DEAH box helicase [Verrucomicrobiales bacterium]|nr:DEAD/DEAH box helicase [Verrucomicrobiales bacterium]
MPIVAPTLAFQPVLDADGCLDIEGEPQTPAESAIQAAWQRGGLEETLTELTCSLLSATLSPPWAWLRSSARTWLRRWCLAGTPAELAPPSEESLQAWLATAPPFPGLQHATVESARSWWQRWQKHVIQGANNHPNGAEGWLESRGAIWHRVGRVTFHLADNAAQPERPFAFLATLADSVNHEGKIQHLPLARAFQKYASPDQQTTLETLLSPIRRAAERCTWVAEWLQTRRLFQPAALTAAEAYEILSSSETLREAGLILKLPNWWEKRHSHRPTVTITLDTPARGGLGPHALLAFRVERSLDGEPLSEEEWQRLISVETGLVSLRGRWVEVHGERLQTTLSHWRRASELNQENGVPFYQALRWLAGLAGPRMSESESAVADTNSLLDPWQRIEMSAELKAQWQDLLQPSTRPPPPALKAQLRPYQAAGFDWLWRMTRLGLGACLADDMGLGKTLQAIALLLAHAAEANEPALIVVPASLLGNWRDELTRFAPSLRVCFAHRSILTAEELAEVEQNPQSAFSSFDVVVTTYHHLTRRSDWQSLIWSLVILDEAQAIKNPAASVTQAMKALQAPARVALSGTPVENQPADLWSLMDFLNPGLLGDASQFAAFLKNAATASAGSDGFAALRRLLGPFVLRRLKTDKRLLPDLPEKIEMPVHCGLTRRQATIYAKLVRQLESLLKDPLLEPRARQGLVLGYLLKFKQVCNHPSHWNGDGIWNPADSGKFLRLRDLAERIHAQRERMLIFTQFRETCTPLARLLESVFGRAGLILHGDVPISRRSEMVAEFQRPGGPPFMVLTVKAGGTGLTLTAASHVIHFDRWWNPAVEDQATDRAYRIGQKRRVLAHKFVCRGTLEQHIDTLLRNKHQLARDLVGDSSDAASVLSGMSPEQLLDLVRLDTTADLE